MGIFETDMYFGDRDVVVFTAPYTFFGFRNS
jgi:hypothetical protein